MSNLCPLAWKSSPRLVLSVFLFFPQALTLDYVILYFNFTHFCSSFPTCNAGHKVRSASTGQVDPGSGALAPPVPVRFWSCLPTPVLSNLRRASWRGLLAAFAFSSSFRTQVTSYLRPCMCGGGDRYPISPMTLQKWLKAPHPPPRGSSVTLLL